MTNLSILSASQLQAHINQLSIEDCRATNEMDNAKPLADSANDRHETAKRNCYAKNNEYLEAKREMLSRRKVD